MFKIIVFIFTAQILMGTIFAQNTSQVQYLQNVDCGSYVDYVATNPGYFRYTPYFVKLYRCHGLNRSPSPRNKRCEPIENGIKTVQLYVFEADGKFKVIELKNHTICKERCVLQPSNCTSYENYLPDACRCSCNYSSKPTDRPCEEPFYWDQSSCDCKCKHQTLTCGNKKQEFNQEICGCTCKLKFQIRCANQQRVLDPNTCECIDPKVITGQSQTGCDGNVKGGVLAVVMIIEALGFILVYFFIYSYCYKRRYLPRKEAKQQNNRTTKQQNNTSSYQNGDIKANRPNESNAVVVREEAEDLYTSEPLKINKDLIKDENKLNENDRLLSPPFYNIDKEKSPISKQDDDWYMYNDVTEVVNSSRGSSVTSEQNRLASQNYSDYADFELENGYGSVSVV